MVIDSDEINIEFTQSSQEYLWKLLQNQDNDNVAVRIFITEPGTMNAETCLAYCNSGEEKKGDFLLQLEHFKVWIEQKSITYLKDAIVDFSTDKMGGELTIKAPNAKIPELNENSSLDDKINYYLVTEINPELAGHGGVVSLIEIDDGYAILQFGGGCQGCGMVDVTLKQGIETTLKNYIPELKGVKDITDHSFKDNAFY